MVTKRSLLDLKEMLIERYDYLYTLYLATQNHKDYFQSQLNDIAKRIGRIDDRINGLVLD